MQLTDEVTFLLLRLSARIKPFYIATLWSNRACEKSTNVFTSGTSVACKAIRKSRLLPQGQDCAVDVCPDT